LNGKPWKRFDAQTVLLPYGETPEVARIAMAMGTAAVPSGDKAAARNEAEVPDDGTELARRAARLRDFVRALAASGGDGGYEAAHARMAIDAVRALVERQRLPASGQLTLLPKASQEAADQSYLDTATRLCDGLDAVVKKYRGSHDPRRAQIYRLYSR
jgi:hypothetical protein